VDVRPRLQVERIPWDAETAYIQTNVTVRRVNIAIQRNISAASMERTTENYRGDSSFNQQELKTVEVNTATKSSIKLIIQLRVNESR